MANSPRSARTEATPLATPVPVEAVAHPHNPSKLAPRAFFDRFKNDIDAGGSMFVVHTDEARALLDATAVVAAHLEMTHIGWDPIDGYSIEAPAPLRPDATAAEKAAHNTRMVEYRKIAAAINDTILQTTPVLNREAVSKRITAMNGAVVPTADPMTALLALPEFPETIFQQTIFSFYDPQPFIDTMPHVRAQLSRLARGNGMVVHGFRVLQLILPSRAALHPDVEAGFINVPFPLPTLGELKNVTIPYLVESFAAKPEFGRPDEDTIDSMARACLGLGRRDAEHVAAVAINGANGFGPDATRLIQDAKCKAINSGGILKFLGLGELVRPEDLAGMEALYDDLKVLATGFRPDAASLNLDCPSGVILAGVSGTGKSAAAKMMASIIADVTGQPCPAIMVEFGALFGGRVGETEGNWRKMIEILLTLGTNVSIFDEWEKISAGSAAGTTGGDGGLSRRLFGLLLTWLADKREKGDRTFVVATMNGADEIPPEMLQRFDGIYFVDLPAKEAIRPIIEIHINKRVAPLGLTHHDLGWSASDWEAAVEAVTDFSGREIARCVSTCRNKAHIAGIEGAMPTIAHWIAQANKMRPTTSAKSDPASLDKLRQFGKNKALAVTRPSIVTPILTPVGGGGRRMPKPSQGN